MPKQLTCPAAGPVTFVVTAGYLDLDVTVDPAARAATAEMTGPPEVLERATAALNRIGGDTWQLSIPQDTRIRGAGIHINGRNTVVTGGGRGSIFMSGSGRIVVNGVDVTDIVSAGQPEDLKVRARLPQGSSLIARVDSGNVAARGTLAGFQLDTTSADAEIQAATVVQARSVSGDISAGCVQGPAELSPSPATSRSPTPAAPSGRAAPAVTSGSTSPSRCTSPPARCPETSWSAPRPARGPRSPAARSPAGYAPPPPDSSPPESRQREEQP
jgi:hypothetical protein